jgi:hypothetical protein
MRREHIVRTAMTSRSDDDLQALPPGLFDRMSENLLLSGWPQQAMSHWPSSVPGAAMIQRSIGAS